MPGHELTSARSPAFPQETEPHNSIDIPTHLSSKITFLKVVKSSRVKKITKNLMRLLIFSQGLRFYLNFILFFGIGNSVNQNFHKILNNKLFSWIKHEFITVHHLNNIRFVPGLAIRMYPLSGF